MSRSITRAAAAFATGALVAGPLAGAAGAAPKPKVPTPIITAKPASPTSATSATFEFTDAQAGVTFQCQLDTTAYAACTSPKTYTGVANGTHTFRVRARNAAGTFSTAATATWVVDTVAPPVPVLSNVPASPTGATSASIGFTSAEAGATFLCSLDGATAAPCTSPAALSSLADGSHTFAVSAKDAVGNVSAPATATWTVDTTPPPAPSVTTGPASLTNATGATFSVFDADPTATLACSLDGAAYAPCTTPVSYTSLGEGAHTFDVKAVDELGNSASAPQWTWTVDLTAPAPPTILTSPAAVTKETTGTFTFDAHDAVLLECAVDSTTEYAACLSTFTTATLADGEHTLRVRGSDGATNVSAPTPYTWTVDATPPPAPSVSGPAAITKATTATFTITSTEDFVTFTCALDGGAAAPCQSGVTYSPVANGTHSLLVTSSDGVGNTATKTVTWKVDTIAPTASVAVPLSLTAPVVVTFSEPVTAPLVAVRVTETTTSLPGTLTCQDAAAATVPCATGAVTTASYQTGRLVPGQRYTVLVAPAGATTADLAGNALATSSVPFRALTTVQENSPAVAHAWRGVRTTAALGGSYVTERLGGAYAVYSFTGTAVTWYTVTGRDQGTASVYVDGVRKALVNNYAASTSYQVARTVSGLSNAKHELRIVVNGARGAASGTNTLVAVDGLKIGSTVVSSPAMGLAWKKLGATAASAGAYTLADLAGAAVTMTFRGTAVHWYTVTGRNHGKAQVFVDGVLKATFDNYSAATAYGVRRSVTGLTDTVHTVRVVVLGQHQAASTGNVVALDRFTIG
ncbi:MAG TPA: hypothetical protein VF519_11645 [Mycobacteriales bacterium]|jgi:hypothetical protein